MSAPQVPATTLELPPVLIRWVREGNLVRTDGSDPYAGRCGAITEKKHPCMVAAGYGTDTKGVGRCYRHPLETHTEGLPPWVGQVDREVWFRITGANAAPPGSQGFQSEHGATDLGTLPIDQLFLRHFDEEERAWFGSIPDDPIAVLDFVIKLRMVALGRVQRELARQRARHQGVIPEGKTVSLELTADKISQTIARLSEAKAKFKEVESGNEVRSSLRDVLRHLSDEDYAALKANPALLAQLTHQHA